MRVFVAIAIALTAGAVDAQDVEFGRTLFQGYCATCHGSDARGDGPMSAILEVLPADLTALAADNEGVFPVARAVMRIDGRDALLAHGGPMPLFGEFFEGEDVTIKAETGQPIFTSRAIADLLAWLRTIQE